jgi:ABC-type dipeptide/oligopeptide/nickel transport system permease component
LFKYIVRRLLLIIPTLFAVSIVVFGTIMLIPGDPAIVILGENAPAEQLDALRARLGVGQPPVQRYLTWLSNVLRGDWGQSTRSRRPVISEIRARMWPTIELAVLATALAVIIGVPIGVLSATKPNTVIDHFATVLAFGGLAMPVFWQGLMAIIIFSVNLRWLPASGRLGGWEYYVLPAVTLGTSAIASVMRMTRSTMLETIGQDYVRTARSKGVHARQVVYRHALRNAMIPVVTIVGLQFGGLLSGAVITETIFGWPGIGRLAYEAIGARDIPVVQGVVLVFALMYALVNLVVDLTYALFDPRVRTRYS